MKLQEFLQNCLIGILTIFLSFMLLFFLISIVNRWRSPSSEGFQNEKEDPEKKPLLENLERILHSNKWENYCAIYNKGREGIQNAEKAESVQLPGPPKGEDRDKKIVVEGDTVRAQSSPTSNQMLLGKIISLKKDGETTTYDIEYEDGTIQTNMNSSSILLVGEGKFAEMALNMEATDVPTSSPVPTISEEEQETAFRNYLNKNVSGKPIFCPLSFPREQLTSIADIYKYTKRIPKEFVANLYSTQYLFSTLFLEQLKEIRKATGIEGFDGFFPVSEIPFSRKITEPFFSSEEGESCGCERIAHSDGTFTPKGKTWQEDKDPVPSKEEMIEMIEQKLNQLEQEKRERISRTRTTDQDAPDSFDIMITQNEQFLKQLDQFRKQAEEGTLPRPEVDQLDIEINL
jgi:hypothetical protein